MSESSEVNRRLVAVFAADVEGYSRLMGTDEVGTLKDLTERRAILDKAIADHRGRIFNTAGDTILAEFDSAVDAVRCALEAQTALAGNAGLAAGKKFNFRIGIAIGDVMVAETGDLLGDGVNIAARLETSPSPAASACPVELRPCQRRSCRWRSRSRRAAAQEHRGAGQGLCWSRELTDLLECDGTGATLLHRRYRLTSPPSRCCRSRI